MYLCTILMSLLTINVNAEFSKIELNTTKDAIIIRNHTQISLRRTYRQLDCTLSERRPRTRGSTRNLQKVNGIESEDACVLACWNQIKRGSQCSAVNYHRLTRACEVISSYPTSSLQFIFDPNCVFLRPAYCRDKVLPPPTQFQASASQNKFQYSNHVQQKAGTVRVTSNIRPGSCGQTSVPQASLASDLRIVGGIEAIPHSIPFIVSLKNSEYKQFCGGSLIRTSLEREESDIIITAAHCSEDETRFYVTAGAHLRAGKEFGVETVPVQRVIMHPQYNPDTVLKLLRPIRFSNTIQPVCLPEINEGVTDGQNGVVAGWGTLKQSISGDYKFPEKLQQVVLPVVNGELCKKIYKETPDYIDTLTPSIMICAGYPKGGKDSCQGDSGGPYFFEGRNGYTIQGIVSYGEGCAKPGYPGVYTRVAPYVNWIQAQMRILGSG